MWNVINFCILGHTLPPDEVTPFTTYPDYRAEYFPELINHAHDDKRPATGRRDGPQGRFGGGKIGLPI